MTTATRNTHSTVTEREVAAAEAWRAYRIDGASPRPWYTADGDKIECELPGGKWGVIATCDSPTNERSENEANAALIVRAVNAHDALLEAALGVLAAIDAYTVTPTHPRVDALRAAIAAAEGETT